ncbi:hypothetical protein TYRP_017849 [Tyrophagus putrescentiae]|nr:hypothetical protein TYRP_017849 [Tyrophagus putrescentiae]
MLNFAVFPLGRFVRFADRSSSFFVVYACQQCLWCCEKLILYCMQGDKFKFCVNFGVYISVSLDIVLINHRHLHLDGNQFEQFLCETFKVERQINAPQILIQTATV